MDELYVREERNSRDGVMPTAAGKRAIGWFMVFIAVVCAGLYVAMKVMI